MAERRMFAKTIIDSDAFLEMPQSTQLLYFHLSMRARDRGILNNVTSIARYVGCSDNDIQTLISREFIFPCGDNEYKITHWYENNGIGETAKKRNNYSYRKWRMSVLERDNYTCQRCGAINTNFNVHHISHWATDITKRYDVDNGITLCMDCHKLIHSVKG